jgi:hypothetical protein
LLQRLGKGKPRKHKLPKSAASLELRGKSLLSFLDGICVQRTLNVQHVLVDKVNAYYVQFALKPALGPLSHLHGTPNKVPVELKPLRDQLF